MSSVGHSEFNDILGYMSSFIKKKKKKQGRKERKKRKKEKKEKKRKNYFVNTQSINMSNPQRMLFYF